MTQVNAVGNSGIVFDGGIVSPNHLTPDEMLIYLQTRLTAIDDQIGAIIDKQNKSEATRKALQACQNETANVGEEGGQVNVDAYVKSLNELSLQAGPEYAEKLFASLPASVAAEITGENGTYAATSKGKQVPLTKDDVTGFNTWTSNAIKDVESGAELDMIKLQSLMAARNTAISLATNITSSMGKGMEAITGNIGR